MFLHRFSQLLLFWCFGVHDKEIKEEAGEEFIDTVLKLEELIATFFTDEFLEGKHILPMINELRADIENSPITKLKQYKLKMLVDDINNNRYRVKSILTRLSNSQGRCVFLQNSRHKEAVTGRP